MIFFKKFSLVLALALVSAAAAEAGSAQCLRLLANMAGQTFKSCQLSSGSGQKAIRSVFVKSDLSGFIFMLEDNEGARQALELFKITEDKNGDNHFINGLRTEFISCLDHQVVFQVVTEQHARHAAGNIGVNTEGKSLSVSVVDKAYRYMVLNCTE